MLRTSSGMQSLYVHDGTGNPAALITSASYTAFAYEYDPYGTATLTENAGGLGVPQNPYTFKNGTQDRATGWIKYGARWYNPATGRWTQQDTLNTPLDPANANRYAYAANDPINNSDPSGRQYGGSSADYGCAPYNTPECAGVSGVSLPPDEMTAKCRISMGWSAAGVFVPGVELFAFAGVFVSALTC